MWTVFWVIYVESERYLDKNWTIKMIQDHWASFNRPVYTQIKGNNLTVRLTGKAYTKKLTLICARKTFHFRRPNAFWSPCYDSLLIIDLTQNLPWKIGNEGET